MVRIPDDQMAEFVLIAARHFGERGDVFDTVSEGPHGQYDFETSWSLEDLSPDDCVVEMYDETVVVRGEVEATYSVQVSRARRNPPGRAHPAEYETRNATVIVSIEMPLDQPPEPVINAEIG